MKKIPTQNKSGMPLLGLGTWKLNGEQCYKTVKEALALGYQHIDTADVYQNHRDIARGIKGYPRDKLYLVTKLFMNELTPDRVAPTTKRFLDELGVGYVDVLLIHWPNPDLSMKDTLDAMIKLKEQGLVKEIGVSNFVRSHLEELAPFHLPILTNQIEMHPYLQRRKLVDYCKSHGIAITAYRPVAKGAFENDPLLQKLGKKYGKSPSQMALKWLIEQDIAVIPKAARTDHLLENMEIFDFELSHEDFEKINSLDSNQRFCTPNGLPIYED